MFKILIIEDDPALLTGIHLALKDDYELVTATCLKEGLKSLNDKIHLVILDLNLPDGNGLSLLRDLKASQASKPVLHDDTKVIILTANDLEIDIVTGLELGADDYITKPFSLAVLRARIKTQLRQLKTPSSILYEHPPFHFDFDRQIFKKDSNAGPDQSFDLSKVEQKCLMALIANRGNTLTRDRLVAKIWGQEGDYMAENALSVTIKRLRDKIETDPSHPEWIKTVYGLGYKWENH